MKDFNQFISELKNVTGNRHHKISGSYGVYDYYKEYRKNKPKDKEFILTEKQYYYIIRRMNSLLGEALSEGTELQLPCRMGKLELRRYRLEPKIVDGKLVYKAPIDWDATLKLWYEDAESLKNKTLVKIDSRNNFRVMYNKGKANYDNKSVFLFTLNRSLKKKVSQSAKDGKIDGFTTKRNYNG